jgi:hypothetical protein
MIRKLFFNRMMKLSQTVKQLYHVVKMLRLAYLLKLSLLCVIINSHEKCKAIINSYLSR